jgi:hypothetical protein
METIRGKTSQTMDLARITTRLKDYERVILDLGTGDGRYVCTLAKDHPEWFILGVDSCRENLRTSSRGDWPNMLFVIASAQALPQELHGLVSHMTINFPWGSLLKSLLEGDPLLMNGLSSIAKPNAQIDIHVNGGAFAEAGTSLESGTQLICENMNRNRWEIKHSAILDHGTLRNFPTTWAKRLAYGRDPCAMRLSGIFGS